MYLWKNYFEDAFINFLILDIIWNFDKYPNFSYKQGIILL